MVDEFDPMVYLFTRSHGTLRISPLIPLSKWIEQREEFDFTPDPN
jgi:hypothetical protein